MQVREFDWERARRHIAEAIATLEKSSETVPELMEQIWAERAERLAEIPQQAETGEQVELLLVRLRREVYGLEATFVREIKEATQITPVPRVPGWTAGVINQRGRILSVIDLGRFLGLGGTVGEEPVLSDDRLLVVVETAGLEVCLLVNDVLAVAQMPGNRVQSANDTVRSIPPEYVRGVIECRTAEIRVDREDETLLAVMLDLPALLGDERLIIEKEIV